ncbi:MAG: lytic transglycosylase domain-containing protein [Prolixibacteraceae bacterium]|nr:lytic transglycosylase domain-containing protein [Prolixibacteraceae bacterium]
MSEKKVWGVVLPGIFVIGILIVFSITNTSLGDPEVKIIREEAMFSGIKIPDSLTFAGERVPLEYFDIRESLERELLVNAYFHSQTIRFIKLAPRYFSVIEPILKEKGIPDDFKYLAVAESNLDPKAVSPANAVGMWQFLKVTAKEYGLEVNDEVDERYHLEKSTYAACDYLKSAYDKFGSWALVAAAYNAGRTFTVNQMERQKNNIYFDMLLGDETERYVFRILALKMVMEHPQDYGFNISDDEKYPIIPTQEIVITGPVSNLADFAKEHGTSYKILKMFNPWLRENYLTNNSGKKYVIKIPVPGARSGNINSTQN